MLAGLQKLTLLDYPGKVACTVFFGGCNFRCPFCHNASLVTHIDAPSMSEDDFFSFLKKREGILEGVCISGGEPTLYSQLPEFVSKIKSLGYSVKLDTNGYNPEMLKYLCENELVDYVAMDIKNSPDKYAVTADLENFDFKRIKESADYLMHSQMNFEFRTTVVKEFHENSDFEQIGKWLKGDENYFLQSFIDSGDTIATGLNAQTEECLDRFLSILKVNIPNAHIRGK